MSKDRSKFTRTTRHLLGPAAQGGDVEAVVRQSEAPTPAYRDRLTWGVSPKRAYDPQELALSIARHPDAPRVFVDTSLFDRRLSPGVWTALLSRPRGITIIPSVREELEPWLQTNRDHPATHAIRLRDAAVELREYDTRDPGESTVFSYYCNLLGIRKKVFRPLRWKFEREHGRSPSPEELIRLKYLAEARYGPRGYMLAKKGEESAGSANFFTDEKLVYTAVTEGIRSGRTIFILTKDEDIQEQFYQLNWLLDTHYRGMLLAEAYVKHPERFATLPMPMDDEAFGEAFTGAGNVLVRGSAADPDALLPSSFTRVSLHCLVMGDLLTQMSFISESQMGALLNVKAETRGLNTNLLNGRNSHFWLGAMPLNARYRDCGALAAEARLPVPQSNATVSLLDVNQAVYTGQPFKGVIRSILL